MLYALQKHCLEITIHPDTANGRLPKGKSFRTMMIKITRLAHAVIITK